METKNLKLRRGLLLIATAAVAFSLVKGRKSDCTEAEHHVHRYEKGKLVRYLPREELEYQGYHWTEDVYYTDSNLYAYLEKEGLLEIAANKGYIREVQNSKHAYYEYENVAYWQNTVGKLPERIDLTTWSTDPSKRSANGRVRICIPQYYAYKVETDARGNRRLLKSPGVEDILEISDEYPYFKEDFVEYAKRSVTEEDAKIYQKIQ